MGARRAMGAPGRVAGRPTVSRAVRRLRARSSALTGGPRPGEHAAIGCRGRRDALPACPHHRDPGFPRAAGEPFRPFGHSRLSSRRPPARAKRAPRPGRHLGLGGSIDFLLNAGVGLLVGLVAFGLSFAAVILAAAVYVSSSAVTVKGLID